MGLFDRVRGLWGHPAPEPLDPDLPELVVVVHAFDEVEACSAALERSRGWVADSPAVLRHHLALPTAALGQAVSTAGQDGYVASARTDGTGAALVLQRVQVLDALHCSQERSRMVGLAQRLGGHVLGWDALQPPGVDGGRGVAGTGR